VKQPPSCGDASYLFVPDQEHYARFAVMLFHEHHPPVDPQAVDLRDKCNGIAASVVSHK